MDSINISDDSSSSDVINLSEESNDDVIEICEISEKNNAQYDHIFKENKLLGEFIEKCLDLEHTKGMISVIDRILIPCFFSTTKMFRKSEIFQSIISKSIRALDSDSDHTFTHIKDLCELMKRKSKRLHAAYLNKLKYPSTMKRLKKIKRTGIKRRKRNEIENIIVSDDSSGYEVPIINLHEIANQVNITNANVPLENEIYHEVETLDAEIDDIVLSTSSKTRQNVYNTNASKHKITDTKFSKNSTRSNINNVYAELPQDNNSKPLGRESNKDYDTEISSTEISSTVLIDDICDDSVKDLKNSDLIVLDENIKELVTTTKTFYKDTNNANPAKEKQSIVPISTEYKGQESIESEVEDLIVLDEDNSDNTTPTKEKENLNVNANKVSTGQKSSLSIKGFVVNEIIVIDEENKHQTNLKEVDENNSTVSVNIIKDNLLLIVTDAKLNGDNVKSPCNNEKVNNQTESPKKEENKLLAADKAQVEVPEETTEEILTKKIHGIECEISYYKTRVAELEKEEVKYDSEWSPYIQCEKYKAKIVKLYQELCELTGVDSVKRREVRLKATNMRSQLSVKNLENLINRSMGDDGLPHFPDFQEVLQCVKQANQDGLLGWNRNEIISEANTLFTQCGRALQKSRMRREWRDMLSLVNSDLVEDPADSDPALMARLQANKQTALKREADLLDRYCEMRIPPRTVCNDEKDISCHSVSDSETENEAEEIISTQETARTINSESSDTIEQCTVTKLKEMEAISKNLLQAVFNKPNANVNVDTEQSNAVFDKPNAIANGITDTHHAEGSTKTTIIGTHVTKERCTPIFLDDRKTIKPIFLGLNPTPKVSENNDPKNISNHNFSLVTKVVSPRIELPNIENPDVQNYPLITDSYSVVEQNNTSVSDNNTENNTSESNNNTENNTSESNNNAENNTSESNNNTENITSESDNTHLVSEIKKEACVKLQNELDELGNDFTATVIDIQDPFLVVEISSDSEDEN